MYKIKVSLTTNPFFFLYDKQPLRAWHNMCSTSISHEKGMFPYKTECIWLPWNKTARCPPLSFFLALKKKKKNCWIPQNPAVKCNSPHQHPPDMEMVTFTPTLHSPPPQVWEFFIFSLLRRLTPKPPCFPLKTFLFALYISALSPFALCFSICLFSSPFWFHFLPPSLPLHLPLYSSPSILASLRWRTPPPSSPSPLFVINQGSEQRHSVRGISREADEISGAHLPALYGDLLGWDKQQASHHSQPNRLPACMCLFLLHCHDHCRCQGWSSPRRPAPW